MNKFRWNTVIHIHENDCYIKDHDDDIKWKPFLHYWPFAREIHRSRLNSQRTNYSELWYFLWSAPEQTVEITIETLGVTSTRMRKHNYKEIEGSMILRVRVFLDNCLSHAKMVVVDELGPILLTWLIFNPIEKQFYSLYLWDETNYLCPNFIGVTAKLWESIKDFIPHFTMGLWLIIHTGIRVNPC